MLKEYLKSLEEQKKLKPKSQVSKETMNESDMGQDTKGILIFAIFWCSIVFAFDGFLIRSTYLRTQTFKFTPVTAKINSSQVEANYDSDGSSFHPKINYEYTVENKKYFSDVIYAAGAGGAGESWANNLIKDFPANKVVTAYVNPQNPTDVTLLQGYSGDELALSIFLTPFNLIALALILALVKRNTLELASPSPTSNALAALGFSTFIASFAVGFIWGFHPSIETGLTIWAVILTITTITYFTSKLRLNNSRRF